MSKKYKMSSAQKRMYAMEVIQEGSISYNVPTLLKVEGEIDLKVLEAAFGKLCDRHELLRTHFMHSNDNFVQIVEETVKAKVTYEEVNGIKEKELLDGFVQPFDLSKAPLMKMKVVKNLSNKTSYLLIDVHHIICDGESLAIIFDELSKLYNGIPLAPIKVQYKNYSAWESKRNIDSQKKSWMNEFENGVTPLELRTDFNRPAWRSSNGDSFNTMIKEELTAAIKEFCKKTKTTEYMFLMAAFMTLLHKYSHQKEIILGTPIAGRTHPDTQNMLGMFVNTLAIKGEIDEKHSFLQFLNSIKEKCLKGYENQDYPFDELIKELKLERNSSRNPIFDVMFGLQNGSESDLKLGKATLSNINHKYKTSKFDLTLMIHEYNENYELYWEYSTDIFKEETIKRMAGHFMNLLTNLLLNPSEAISKVQYISEEEKIDLKKGLNPKVDIFPINETLIALFEKSVNLNADNIAVQFENETITYSELNERANYVGSELLKKGVNKDSIVGIMSESSIGMIAAVLGALKAGAAYLPIDPSMPLERLSYIIKDSKMDALITSQANFKVTDLSADKILQLESLDGKSAASPRRTTTKNSLAYVIYTSGSTGNPKGVMVTNENIVNQVYWHITEAELTYKSRYIQNTAFIFDGSALEIFSTLLSGAQLLLVDSEKKKEPEELLKLLPGAHINILPSMFRALVEYAIDNKKEEALNSFERLNLVAEKIPGELIEKYNSTKGSKLSKLWNLYGPTEATITSTSYQLNENMNLVNIPIGKPVSNYKVYILHENDLCAKGILGEICISGRGISKGYLNNTKLTEEAFIYCPTITDEVIYRTGDIGFINQDGEVELVGRMDEQVKIRGFRVELQEIESTLKGVEGVKEAVVVRQKNLNDDFLVAYFVGDKKVNDLIIKDNLSNRLPEYMVPEFIIRLDEIPLLPNGKLNKKSLGELKLNKLSTFEKPNNSTEEDLCDIFSKVLGFEKISINTSFFELGGDSIKAIRIVSKLREKGYGSTVKNIMQHKTVQKIAQTLKEIKDTKYLEEEVAGEVPLTPIQSDFFMSHLEAPNHFNQSVVMESKNEINLSAFKKALEALVLHHDQLRAHFVNGKQIIRSKNSETLFAISEFKLGKQNFNDVDLKVESIGNKLQTSLDIEKGPLIKCAVLKSQRFNGVILCIHHLLVDNVSWGIILEDLNRFYDGFSKNIVVEFPQKTLSYKNWSIETEKYFDSLERTSELEYWKKVQKEIESSQFPYYGEGDIANKGIQESEIQFGKELTSNLIGKAKQAYYSEVNELLFAALFRTIQQIGGNSTVSLNMESHGRPEIFEEVSVDRTVGWFTTIFPITLSEVGKDIRLDIRRTKKMLRSVPNYGVGFGIAKKLKLIEKIENQPFITLNYFGEQSENSSGDFFQPNDMSSGKQIDDENKFSTPITINCEVIEAQLKVIISYNTEVVPVSLIEDLEFTFKKQLNDVVSHCVLKEVSEYTASDFNEMEWTDSDFEYCINHLDKRFEKLESIYPLTPMQQGMLFHKMENSDSSNYVLQSVFSLNKKLDNTSLEKSLLQLGNKHSILKTSVIYKEVSIPRQVVPKQRKLELNFLDLTNEVKKEGIFANLKIKDKSRGFDLEEDSLLRLTAVKMNEEHFKIIMSSHHIIMDGWSLPIVVHDLLEYYEANTTNLNLGDLSKERQNFGDYVQLINKRKDSIDYWRDLLNGLEEKTSIIEEGKPENGTKEVKDCQLLLDKNDTKKLRKLSENYHVTINTIIETLWGILLQKYNHVTDSIFGKVVSGRDVDIPGIEQMVGLFINTIPVRVTSQPNQKLTELLQDVQKQALNSGEYDHMSLTKIQNETKLGSGVIQTILAFENYFVEESSETDELEMEEASEQTNFDLALSVFIEEQLSLNLMYQTNKYNYEEVSRVLVHFKNLLLNIIKNPDVLISELSVLDNDEKEIILTSFNNEISNEDQSKTIIQLFEENVREFPDHIAVEFEGQQLTYRELNSKSNYLAKQMKGKDIKPNDVVALISERTCEMIIAIYAILKAGAAYLPIDPKQPLDRIKYMLKDSKAKLIIAGANSGKLVKELEGFQFINFEDNLGELENNLSITASLSDLAYIIYTSGTTGNPKGVMIENRNVVNLTNWLISHLNLDEFSTMLQNFAFIFDGSVWEIFSSGLAGSRLLILSDEQKASPKETIECFNNAHVIMVPSMYRELLEYAKTNGILHKLHALNSISLGGEAMTLDLASEFFETSKEFKNKPRIQNCYGPTEATVCSTFHEFKEDVSDSRVLVGKPILNSSAFIMNQNELIGIGMIGELFIGGYGIAPGYLNNDKLSKEKFVNHPYEEGKVLYQTGDLARWDKNGNIELFGRIGEQVKIRGFRIELGEIESYIRQFKDITDAVVILDENDRTEQIVAYFTSRKEIDISRLKETLFKKLNDYMVPEHFIQIDEIPKTLNGKINKRNLPKPTSNRVHMKILPKSEIEKAIYDAFQEVLLYEELSTDDNFFDVGGDSIKAIRVVSNLNRVGYDINVRTILKYQNIQAICEFIQSQIQDKKYEEKDIRKIIWNNYSKLCLIDEVKIESGTFNILYVDNLSEQLYQNIIQLIEEEKIKNLSLDFIVSLDQYNAAYHCETLDELKLLFFDNQLDRNKIDYYEILEKQKNNYQNAVENSYPLTKIQEFYCSTTEGIINEQIILSSEGSFTTIKEALLTIIKEYGVLRSSYSFSDGEQRMNEHQFDDSWFIPYIDMRNRTGDSDVSKKFADYVDLKHYSSQNKNPLSSILVTQLTESKYQINLVIDHCIWDKASSQIFREKLETLLLGTSYGRTKVSPYVSYIREVQEVTNTLVNNIEIKETISNAKELIYQTLERNANKVLRSTEDKLFELGPNTFKLYQESPWQVIEHIIKVIVHQNKLANAKDQSYPVLIVQDERNFMDGNYAETLGEFLDLVPASVKLHETGTLQNVIQNLQSIKKEEKINFTEAIFEQSEDIRELFSKVLLVNYQGAYDISSEELQEWLAAQNKNFSSTEIFINDIDNQLIVTYPVFDICERDIEEEIQSSLNELEKLLDLELVL
ncbi:Long-chain-fatty-acid--CoA ligase [Bacillus mycoides]|uniref:non-ribosomal peptide synthetase n=1 Tax=Bacillus mycoides TaxID=1405 RepID=UPI0007AB2E66|nr:non-ribosomal peptide synthetase [Bacillus mycoides]KZE03981.1 Long-chain-fatty-acid--CoA ligase [Bacillus mycoides]